MQEMQEMEVRSLGQEDPLEEEMATHPVFLHGESLENPGRLQSIGSQKSCTQLSTHIHTRKYNKQLCANKFRLTKTNSLRH